MVYRGLIEHLKAAEHARLLADGWVQGRPLKLTDDQLAHAYARLAMITADTDDPGPPASEHEPMEAVLSSDYDFGPRQRWLDEADEQLGIDRAVELVNGGDGSAVSRAAQIMAKHQAAERRSRAAAAQAQPRTCGTPNDLGYCTERHHNLWCKTIQPTPDMAAGFASREDSEEAWEAAAEWREDRAGRAALPYVDSAGRVFLDQHGQAMNLTAIMDEKLGAVSARGYGPQKPELRIAQRIPVSHTNFDPVGEEHPPETSVRARALKEEYEPSRETPRDLAERRALRGGHPALARHWGDAYPESVPDWDAIARG